MNELSDTQAVILTAACAREGGLVLPVTANLKGGAVNMVLASLIKKELVEEVRAEPGAPIWREDDAGTPLTLRATPAAYMALGIVADTGAETAPQEEPPANVVHTPQAPSTEADTAADEAPEIGTSEGEVVEAGVAPCARKARAGSKQEALVALLKRPEGASIDEIREVTAWQAHSVRGFIAGTLKKKLGLTVASEKNEVRGRIYKIAG